jgi:hypothetical protein
LIETFATADIDDSSFAFMVPAMKTVSSFILAMAAFAVPASAADHNYAVTDFDRVVITGPYSVQLVVGAASSAVGHGSRDALDRVTVDVQSGTLRIQPNHSAWGGAPGADVGVVTIVLATREIRSVRAIGPVLLDVDGGRGLNLQFMLQGSGRIRATHVTADNVSLGLLGSGRLEISGAARALVADVQGTGDVDASHLVAHNATLSTTTIGTVALNVNGPATVNANGLGNVVVTGQAACTVRGPGAGQVSCGGSNQR